MFIKPNITFIFQILNFIFVFVILKKTVFKSVFEKLTQEKEKQVSLFKSLQESEVFLLNIQKDKIAKLKAFQKKMSEKFVFASDRFAKLTKDISYKRDPDGVKRLTKEFKSILIREVSRVK